MLLDTILDTLPMAVGVALSPIQIATVVSILLSNNLRKASVFLLGWSAGILAIGILILFIPGLRMLDGDPTPLAAWLRVFLGLGLFVLAWGKWTSRPSSQEDVQPPAFLEKIHSLGSWKTLLMGGALSMLMMESGSASGFKPPQPVAIMPRMSAICSASITSFARRCGWCPAIEPKPTYTGGAPASRKVRSSRGGVHLFSLSKNQ